MPDAGSADRNEPVVLSDAVRAVCRAYWRTDKRSKRPAADCCKGCPIGTECSAPPAPGYAGLYAHREQLNRAAALVVL